MSVEEENNVIVPEVVEEEKKPKKRGRKSKKKEEPEKPVERKKRGRKRKCEMNLELHKKISGYVVDGNSIDIKGNEIQFNTSDVPKGDELEAETDDENTEKLVFGILNIKRHNVAKVNKESFEDKQPDEKINQSSGFLSKCDIDISLIVEIEKDIVHKSVTTKQTTIRTEKTDLSNFFEGIPSEKNMLFNDSKGCFNGNIMTSRLGINKAFKANDSIVRYKFVHYKKGKEFEIPTKTDIWCWWCSHPFDSIPRFIPSKYDNVHKRFKVFGNFCSWSCAVSYCSDVHTSTTQNLLNYMINTLHGSNYSVPKAPPKSLLKVFGGPMDIQEFRNIDKNEYFELYTNKMMLDEDMYITRYKNK